MMKKGVVSLLVLIGLAVLYPTHFVHAYLDPGTGSYAIQALIGVVFGAAYTMRSFGGRLRAGWQNRFGKKRTEIVSSSNSNDGAQTD